MTLTFRPSLFPFQPVQVVPSPVKPGLQEQRKPLRVLVQSALLWQLFSAADAHSSTSGMKGSKSKLSNGLNSKSNCIMCGIKKTYRMNHSLTKSPSVRLSPATDSTTWISLVIHNFEMVLFSLMVAEPHEFSLWCFVWLNTGKQAAGQHSSNQNRILKSQIPQNLNSFLLYFFHSCIITAWNHRTNHR